MATVQMNTRIDSRVKKAGDAAIKAAGYTPTKSVNLFWEYMANNKHDKEKIAKFYNELDPKNNEIKSDTLKELTLLSNPNKYFELYCKKNGLPYKPPRKVPRDERWDSSNNAVLRDLFYEERLKKYE